MNLEPRHPGPLLGQDSGAGYPGVGGMTPRALAQPASAQAPVPGWGILELVLGVLLILVMVTVLAVGLLIVRRPGVIPDAELRIVLQSLLGLATEAVLVVPVWLFAVARGKGGWAAVGFRRVGLLLGLMLPLAYLIVAFAGEGIWAIRNQPSDGELARFSTT